MVDWPTLIATAKAAVDPPLNATIHHEGIVTASQPQKYTCGSDGMFVVKFANNDHGDGRAIATEQVVARSGALLGASVPELRGSANSMRRAAGWACYPPV